MSAERLTAASSFSGSPQEYAHAIAMDLARKTGKAQLVLEVLEEIEAPGKHELVERTGAENAQAAVDRTGEELAANQARLRALLKPRD